MPNAILDNLKRLDLQIYRSIASHPNLSKIEDIELHTTQKHIRLRGTVGSFFEKQLVGETIRELDKDRLIENELSVSWD
ncbi:MAG: BON domain-containing protein [Planctomycetota bacterium]|nr:BON domain-containing protein [Planctomycetota bacterium]